jgi:hypothetical protein
MAKIDGLEIVMTKQMQKMIDKELKKRFEELKPELATRYEELLNTRNMETDQFNDGFNDARAGKLETDHPHYDLDTDNWRLGYAWGMFEPMKEKLARERQVSDALYLLLVDDPNTKLKAEQILIDIYGKCEPSPSDSDVSVTQDVITGVKTPESIENPWIPISSGILPNKFQECIVLDSSGHVHNWMHDDVLLPLFAQYTHWMPLPEPPEGEKC